MCANRDQICIWTALRCIAHCVVLYVECKAWGAGCGMRQGVGGWDVERTD